MDDDDLDRIQVDARDVPGWVRPALEAEAQRRGFSTSGRSGLTALIRWVLIDYARKFKQKGK